MSRSALAAALSDAELTALCASRLRDGSPWDCCSCPRAPHPRCQPWHHTACAPTRRLRVFPPLWVCPLGISGALLCSLPVFLCLHRSCLNLWATWSLFWSALGEPCPVTVQAATAGPPRPLVTGVSCATSGLQRPLVTGVSCATAGPQRPLVTGVEWMLLQQQPLAARSGRGVQQVWCWVGWAASVLCSCPHGPPHSVLSRSDEAHVGKCIRSRGWLGG